MVENFILPEKKLCVVGKKLPHTLSPRIFEEFGCKYDVREFDFEEKLIAFIKFGGYDGINVTVPYKQTVLRALDYVDEAALKIGAVNTIVRREDKLYGYNTDVDGMNGALEKAEINLLDKKVAVLGSGGTSHTAAYVAKQAQAKSIIVISRSGEINYENVKSHGDVQIVINTTPVGMFPEIDENPIDLRIFNKLEGVFDCVYNPLKTSLVMQAEELSVRATNGLYMLVEQARRSRDLFFGDTSTENLTDKVFSKLQKEEKNLVLIGMPGSGKTTIGRELAKLLGKDFIDTDEEVSKMCGKSIPDIFAEDGEIVFREFERQAVASAAARLNTVISTGGGTVLNADNRKMLRHNGYIILINRDISQLEISGRPISEKGNLQKLFDERMPVYSSFKDAEIYCNGNIYDTVSALKRVLSL